MKKRGLFVIAGLAMVSPVSAQAAADTLKMSLADCIEYAIDHNYGREGVRLNEDAKKSVYEQSKMERLPDVSATLNEGVGHTSGTDAAWNGSYEVTAGVVLFQGGQISETIRQNRLSLEQSAHKTKQYDYEKDKSITGLKQALGLQWDIQVVDYQSAMKNYNAVKTMHNVALIREYDAKSKGFENSLTPTEKLLPELLFKLMH